MNGSKKDIARRGRDGTLKAKLYRDRLAKGLSFHFSDAPVIRELVRWRLDNGLETAVSHPRDLTDKVVIKKPKEIESSLGKGSTWLDRIRSAK